MRTPDNRNMPHVLIVEDSKVFGGFLKKRIERDLQFRATWVRTFAEAAGQIEQNASDFLMAILDLNLPDAPMGEIIDLSVSRGVPSVVFTGSFSESMRNAIWSYKVVDYVLKERPHNIDYIVSLVRRIERNRSTRILIVDDSKTSRKALSDLLKVHLYKVHEAADGIEALSILDLFPDTSLVITDYRMPKMDGFQLTNEIRDRFSKNDLAVIGMSTQSNNTLSARFIKNGANDFITKPFVAEELYCRVTQNIEMIENIAAIRDTSNRDYLTRLYNRRYLFESGRSLHAAALRGHVSLIVAMVDIDNFKKVNDTYGHDAGDDALREVASLLQSRFRDTDIVARIGGEEFCILALGMDPPSALEVFDGIREKIAKTAIQTDDRALGVTVSIGVCTTLMRSLDGMVKRADDMLYRAKKEGRNRVLLTAPAEPAV